VIVVVDTGPLVYLAQLNRLTLLQDLYEPYVPPSVLDEISAWSSDARRLVQAAADDWLRVMPISDSSLRDLLLP
jgi:predicted nucleic acid-binding protein